MTMPGNKNKNDNPSDEGISMSEKDLSIVGNKFVIPVKSRITKIGSSCGVIVPTKVLEHLGFKEGDTVDVILQHRNPSDEEISKYRSKHEKKLKNK
jgi:predicted DNA-binding antitoxin AbrB/MazE fold protein